MKWIINTITSWNEAPRARHQVTNELVKKGEEVVFIERNSFGWLKLEKKEITPNFTIITPYFPISYKLRTRVPVINELYQLWLYAKLKQLFSEHSMINFDFTAYLLFQFFNKTIYYCNDEYIGNSKYPSFLINRYHSFCEKRVISNSKFCISTSEYLTNKLLKYSDKVYEIPLGGPDLSSFNFVKGRRMDGLIHVGLVGFINSRTTSITLINSLLSDPSVRMTMVGPVESDFLKKIINTEKLNLTGTLTNDNLYQKINSFDVAIAPYNLEKKNPGTSPNKLFLYLACGKPVVMSDLQNMKKYNFPEKSVYIARNESDFLPLIHKAFNENSADFEIERRRLASENTWGKRIEKLFNLAFENGFFKEKNSLTENKFSLSQTR